MMLTQQPISSRVSQSRRSAAPSQLCKARVSLRVRAEQAPTEPATPKPEAPSTSGEKIEVKKVDASAPLLQKGQGTAIVTGAISAILGLAYLALVAFMDQRGGQMLPPPPEALIP
eukprot:XP_001690968.1 predicted protein [Chlamydomonas reinhardtii]